jgi:hypothetical protein
MSEQLKNFRAWYVAVLAQLYPIRDAGIAVFMISLPLFERYLRQKNKLGPDDKLDAAMPDVCVIFPALKDAATAKQFWAVYRHGFLHQVTLSQKTWGGTALPQGWLTHDIAEPVRIEADGSFCVNPVLLSQEIIAVIEADFATFAGVVAGTPPLPAVTRRDPVTIPSSYLGTGTP